GAGHAPSRPSGAGVNGPRGPGNGADGDGGARPGGNMGRFGTKTWIAALALCAGAARAGDEIPRQADARAQIRFAASIRREGRGLKGDERIEHLKHVAAGYEAVGAHFPESKAECAEALFRLGEVRRALGDRAGAISAFEGVVANGSQRRFAARALL